MKLPLNKKLIVWLPVCKAGMQSMIKIFKMANLDIVEAHSLNNDIKPNIKIVRAPSVYELMTSNKFIYFQNHYSINDIYFIINVRNPYQRALSAWRFHRYFKNITTLKEALLNPPQPIPDHKNKKQREQSSGWRHFTKTMTERVLFNNKLCYDFCIRLESFQEDMCKLGHELEIPITQIPKINVTNSSKTKLISIEEELLIEKLFANDFKNFNYELKNHNCL